MHHRASLCNVCDPPSQRLFLPQPLPPTPLPPCIIRKNASKVMHAPNPPAPPENAATRESRAVPGPNVRRVGWAFTQHEHVNLSRRGLPRGGTRARGHVVDLVETLVHLLRRLVLVDARFAQLKVRFARK